MNERQDNSEAVVNAAVLDNEQLRELRAAEQCARTLREEAIAREQARLRAVMQALNVTAEELLGLPPRKRRRSKVEAE